MGKGWAVPQAASLALVLIVTAQAMGKPTGWWPLASSILLALGGLMWAYALADAAYGSKAALVAIAVYAAAGVGLAGRALKNTPDSMPTRVLAALAALVSFAALVAALMETRARRGSIKWGAVIVFTLPVLALVIVLVRALVATPSS